MLVFQHTFPLKILRYDLFVFHDITGFVQGWTGSEKCLARCKKGKPDIPLKTDKVVYYTDPDDMAKAVINGTVITHFLHLFSFCPSYSTKSWVLAVP